MSVRENHPSLYIIAGPNGAGKTTFAREFLPKFAHCKIFVNADSIASGLAAFAPRVEAVQAGRIMLGHIRKLANQRQTFAFETTLSGRRYLSFFRELKQFGYHIHLTYLWLPSVALAIQRVKDRVIQGGHSVPEEDIRRRFNRGLKNLFSEYKPLLDTWLLLDNSERKSKTIAFGKGSERQIIDGILYEKVLKSVEEK